MTTDAQRWNARYADGTPPDEISPHPVVVDALTTSGFAAPGRAGDIACGWGDAALWCAQQGFETTSFDVSSIALDAVAQRAEDAGLSISTAVHDTTIDGVPAGPWDFLCCVHYLDRTMLQSLTTQLRPGGIAAVAIATKANLERHVRPSARFLLDPGELADLVAPEDSGIEILRADEAWRDNGVHEAWLIATVPRLA